MDCGRRLYTLLVVVPWLMIPAASAETPGEARFFADCPHRRYVQVHRDTNPWDVHALLYTTMGLMELEVLRLADWVIDLPLPGAPLHPFQRAVQGTRSGYDRLPPWLIRRRLGELVDALQVPELSLGDVSAAYSVAGGGAARPGSGTLLRVNKLVDWAQHVSGDLNRLGGRMIGAPQGLIRWSMPGTLVDGTQWVLNKTFHHVSLFAARAIETSLDGVERSGEGVMNLGYRWPHQEETVFVRVPVSVYRVHELWILEHQPQVVVGTEQEFAAATHAAMAHHRRASALLDVSHVDRIASPEPVVVLMMSVRVFSGAPASLRPYVVPAAWVLNHQSIVDSP